MEKKTFENVYLKCRHKSTIPPNWPAILLRIEWRKKRKIIEETVQMCSGRRKPCNMVTATRGNTGWINLIIKSSGCD